MKKFYSHSLVILAVALAFGFARPTATLAATTPSLGAATTYGVLSSTYTNTTVTTINGDVGFTTGPAVAPLGTHTNYGSGAPYSTAGTDEASALSALAAQPCTFNFAPGAIDLAADTTHGPIGVYTPGVYCVVGAASIGTGGINLSGSGTYIFRINGAFTTVANSVVSLSNGASACDVFWTPTSATTLGANSTFVGTDINPSGITVGSNTTYTGRALAFESSVITDTDTITVPSCAVPVPATEAVAISGYNTITVIKQVINDGGGTAKFSDFQLFVNGNPVVSGQTIRFTPGTYTVTETNLPGYKATFGGDCNASGQINHGGANTKNDICTVINDDISAPVVPPVPPLIDVVKVPSPLSLPDGPGLVTYTYTLRNIGTVPVTDVTMVGDTCYPVILVSGDANADAKLDLNETWTYRCSITLSATHTNTVVATGWANGLSASDLASANVVVGVPVVPPLIHVTKVPSPLTLLAGGGMVTYTEKITNPGTVALSNVLLNDDRCAPMNYVSGDTNNDQKLDTTETWTYTCQENLAKTTVNTAIASGVANGLTARDAAIATVVVAAAVPGLPSTGTVPGESNIPWNLVVFSSMFAASLILFLIRKRQAS